jgi:hypothetical protein
MYKMNILQNTSLTILVIIIIIVSFYSRVTRKEQFVEEKFPDYGLMFAYAHIYAIRNSGNLDEARAKMDKLFIKLRYPIDEIKKANTNYNKYDTYFKSLEV